MQTLGNIIITGEIDGSFFPRTQMEIPREVLLQSPFYLSGGLYAQNIRNKGAGTVTGSVIAGREITLTPSAKNEDPIRFLSGINATHSIMVQPSGNPIEQTAVNGIENAKVIVRGDVLSDTVRLENSLIIGNVRSRQAFIENSMIVGSVMAEEELHLTNSIFLSFSAGKAHLHGQNSCWLPHAISRQPIQFESNESGISAELRYMALCRTEAFGCGRKDGNLCCEPFINRQCEHQEVRLSTSDIHPHITQDGEQLYALTLARRALNLTRIQEELHRVKDFLKELLLYEHLDEASKKQATESWKGKYQSDELAILRLSQEVCFS
jgi:hypothetical protein